MNIKIGAIGCGKQAEKHINALKKIPGMDIVVSDIDDGLAQKFALQVGLDWRKNTDEILEDETINAVIICTPTQSHVSLIELALKHDKDVFCEKPISYSIEDTNRLKKLTDVKDRIVQVGYVYRFVPIFEEGYRLFKEQVVDDDSLVMGRTLSAFFRLGGRGSHQAWKHLSNRGGGAINEMLVHMIDLANWYFGPLSGFEVIANNLKCPERTIGSETISVDAEDFVFIRCRSESGIEIYCQADLITPAFSQYVEIQSENGTFMGSIQPDMPSYVFLKEAKGGFDAGKTKIQFGRRNIFDAQMLYFVHSVINREFSSPRNSLHDSIELLRILDEINHKL